MRIALNLNLLNEHTRKINNKKKTQFTFDILCGDTPLWLLCRLSCLRCKYGTMLVYSNSFCFPWYWQRRLILKRYFLTIYYIIKDLFRFLILRSFSLVLITEYTFLSNAMRLFYVENTIYYIIHKACETDIFFGDSLSFLNSFFHFSTLIATNSYHLVGMYQHQALHTHRTRSYTKQQNLCLLSKPKLKTNFTRSKLKPIKLNQRKNNEKYRQAQEREKEYDRYETHVRWYWLQCTISEL